MKHTMTRVLTFWNDVAMLLMLLVLVVLATGGHSKKGVMVSGKRCWFPFTYNFQRWVVKMRTDTRIDSQLNQFMYFFGGLSMVSPDPSISHQFSMFLSRIPWCFSGILETNRLITFTTKFHISLINFNTGYTNITTRWYKSATPLKQYVEGYNNQFTLQNNIHKVSKSATT